MGNGPNARMHFYSWGEFEFAKGIHTWMLGVNLPLSFSKTIQ